MTGRLPGTYAGRTRGPKARGGWQDAFPAAGSFLTRDTTLLWILLAPSVLCTLVVLAYPLARVLGLSFYAKTFGGGSTFVGLANYKGLFRDKLFWSSVRVTVWWVLGSVAGQMLLGLVLALLLQRDFRGCGLLRTLFVLPWAVPNFVAAITWVWMYSDRFGVLSQLVRALGIGVDKALWLGNPRTALFSCVLANIWKNYAFVMVMLLAGLQAIPGDLYEAARIDGASAWEETRFVTMPMLKTTLLIVLMLRLIWTFNNFELIFIMTEGGPAHTTEVLTISAYIRAFRTWIFGYASAMGSLMFVATLIFCIIYLRIYGRQLRGETWGA